MDVYEAIDAAEKEEIADILDYVLFRYKQLHPRWELSVISIEKAVDKNEQLDKMIELLQNMKEN